MLVLYLTLSELAYWGRNKISKPLPFADASRSIVRRNRETGGKYRLQEMNAGSTDFAAAPSFFLSSSGVILP